MGQNKRLSLCLSYTLFIQGWPLTTPGQQEKYGGSPCWVWSVGLWAQGMMKAKEEEAGHKGEASHFAVCVKQDATTGRGWREQGHGETRSPALCACIFSLAENRTKLWTKIAIHLHNILADRTPPAEDLGGSWGRGLSVRVQPWLSADAHPGVAKAGFAVFTLHEECGSRCKATSQPLWS